jgi:hypothetical protein
MITVTTITGITTKRAVDEIRYHRYRIGCRQIRAALIDAPRSMKIGLLYRPFLSIRREGLVRLLKIGNGFIGIRKMKSHDGNDFAPRLHGRGPEVSVRTC